MRRVSVLICGFVAACNYDTGECYLRDEGGQGSGGVIVPTGAGGFGDVPPEPQDAADPEAGCAPDRTCTDMYVACQDKGPPCDKVFGHKSLCAYCQDNCLRKEPYRYAECHECGFE